MFENPWYEVSSIRHTSHSLAFVKIGIERGERYKVGKRGELWSTVQWEYVRILKMNNLFRGKYCT